MNQIPTDVNAKSYLEKYRRDLTDLDFNWRNRRKMYDDYFPY